MSVSIDNDFARFGAKSYAINKITSVEVREVRDKNNGCLVALFGFIAVVMGVTGLGNLLRSPNEAIMSLLVAALFGYLTYTMVKKGRQITYHLFLITSSSEQQAYTTSNRDDVYDLRDQIEGAMLHHSRGMNGRD